MTHVNLSTRTSSLLLSGLAIVVIAGCSTTPSSTAPVVAAPPPAPTPASPASAAPNAATKAAATKANLAIEKLRLSELFRGTPVLFALQPDGNLRVDVPLQYSFDAGKALVKPPLAAVLDNIANGQRNELTQVVVRAPGDATTRGGTLVADRAAGVRDHLVSRGVAGARVSIAPSAGPAIVRIVVSDAPQP